MSIFITSDLHFAHNKHFLYEPRGFTSVEEHNQAIIANWNEIVGTEDDIYVLGDLMLGNADQGMECLTQLNGRLHLVRGNHDTDRKWNELYPTLPNVVEFCGWATVIKYKKQLFHLSHWATCVSNYGDEKNPMISLSGHTHKKEVFHNGNIGKYNVALDAHNNYPVSLEKIKQDIKVASM